jgi:hypothetical protein
MLKRLEGETGMALIVVAMAALALGAGTIVAPAVAAENYDGTYTGKRALMKGVAGCATEPDVSATIGGQTLEATSSGVRDLAIGFVPRPDGSFRMTATSVAGGKAFIKGRIAGGVIDADVTIGPCRYHWHLMRG